MERDADLGYVAVKKQASKLVAVTPDTYLPLYAEDVGTNPNYTDQNPIIGSKFGRRSTLRGQRGHTGSMTFEGEPVTAGYLADMFMTKGSSTGTDPKTHPFTLSKTTDPNYYTADVSLVTHVKRLIGLAVSSIAEEWEGNELRLNCGVSCLRIWDAAELASTPTGTNPWTLVFKTEKEPRPTDGLVVGDTLQVYKMATGLYINITIATINANGTTITTTTADPTSASAGDIVTIKPVSSPSYSNLPTFEFANTEYRFGADAAAALTATHTPLEQDTSLSLSHEFEDAEGSKRSGSYDPYSLPRLQGLYEFTHKKYFDTPTDMQKFISMDKTACVVRHFSYSGGLTYELRITLNNLTSGNPIPKLSPGEILYSEIENKGNLDVADGQGMGLTVLNNVASI